MLYTLTHTLTNPPKQANTHRDIYTDILGHSPDCEGKGSRVRLFETPWTVAQQAPLSKGFSRQEYWMRCLLFLTQGLKLHLPPFLHWQEDSFTTEPPGKQNIS